MAIEVDLPDDCNKVVKLEYRGVYAHFEIKRNIIPSAQA
jgi:hypothetical protein